MAILKNCVADQGEVVPGFSVRQTHMHRFKMMVRVVNGLKNAAVFQSGSQHYASMGDTSSRTNST